MISEGLIEFIINFLNNSEGQTSSESRAVVLGRTATLVGRMAMDVEGCRSCPLK